MFLCVFVVVCLWGDGGRGGKHSSFVSAKHQVHLSEPERTRITIQHQFIEADGKALHGFIKGDLRAVPAFVFFIGVLFLLAHFASPFIFLSEGDQSAKASFQSHLPKGSGTAPCV
jgi:hypothetical protein